MAQIEAFLNSMKVNGIVESTVRYYTSILKDIDKFKSLDKPWTENDIDAYVLFIKGRNRSASIETKKVILKKFFQWAGHKEIVEHLQIKHIKSSLKREDILDANDVTAMIEAAESPMYKALISFLFESGARINEALAVTLKDIQETEQGMIINIPSTKTGDDHRRGIYPISSGYIRNHIMYGKITGTSRIFPITQHHANRMLQRIGKKAGIEKPVTCHKFRHAQATDMVVRGYQESIIRKKLGWTPSSRMLETYTHIVDDDVINATLSQNGQEVKHNPIVNVKTAEPMTIVDMGGIVTKLVEKNTYLEEQIEALRDIIEQEREDRKNETIKAEYEKIKNKDSNSPKETLE